MKLTANKKWDANNPESVTKPGIKFELWRKNGLAGTVEKVKDGILVDNTANEVNFGYQDKTDINGVGYDYFVKEVFADNDVLNDNWVTTVDGLTVTNSVIDGNDKLGKLTVNKVLENEVSGNRTVILSSDQPLKFSFRVTGPYGYQEDFQLTAGETKELTGLYYGNYKVEELTPQGYVAEYSVTDGKVTLSKGNDEASVTVTNKRTNQEIDPNKISMTLEKVWYNGPKPNTTIELWRKGQEVDGSPIDQKIGEFTATATENSKEFTGLAKHDPSGREYQYYAKEPNIPDNYIATFNGTIATNTYFIPKTDTEIVAQKYWDISNDPAVTKVDIKFELWRKNGSAGDGEKVVDGTELTDDKVDFGKQDKTDINGAVYEYFVKEVYNNPQDPLNHNWVVTESGLTVNNRVINNNEKLGKLFVKKIFKNEATDNRMMKLFADEPLEFSFRVTGPYGYEETFTLNAGETRELTDIYYGVYTVTEINTFGYEVSSDPANGMITLTKDSPDAIITVTNRRTGGDTDLNVVSKTIKKVWEKGPKPNTTIELWRKGQEVDGSIIDEKVDEFTATATQTSKEFVGLTKHDPSGREYQYYAKEPSVPENYTKTEEGLTVTNTYVIPKTNITGTKEWSGGPTVKPTIQLQLYRDGEVNGEPVTLENGTTSYTWEDLDETDIDGNKYVYTIDEVEVPSRYKKSISEDGLTVINKYRPSRPNPETPIDPNKPEEAKPEEPVTPEEPGAPDKPEGPEVPTPTEPEEPVIDPGAIFGSILINKLDLESNPLEGAEFTIYNASKVAIRTVISDIKGTVLFSDLPLGTYFIMETKAPEGYILVDDELSVSLKDTKSLKYNFRNAPEGIDIEDPDLPLGWEPIEDADVPTGTLPNTGYVFDTFMLILIGAVMIIIGFGMLLKRRLN